MNKTKVVATLKALCQVIDAASWNGVTVVGARDITVTREAAQRLIAELTDDPRLSKNKEKAQEEETNDSE